MWMDNSAPKTTPQLPEEDKPMEIPPLYKKRYQVSDNEKYNKKPEGPTPTGSEKILFSDRPMPILKIQGKEDDRMKEQRDMQL